MGKIIKGLYVDDIRNLPSWAVGEWDIARNYDEAIDLLTKNEYDELSLDHDIASYDEYGREMTGYDIALWLVYQDIDKLYVPPKIYCHSANPVGAKNILGVIERYLSNDNCEVCHGERGGVKGNENIVDGKLICDYCHGDKI